MAGCENVGVRWKNPTKKRANLESLNISRGEAISTWKNVKLKVLTIQPCPTLYDPINSHRLPEEPTRLLCPWNCLGKSTGVAYHSRLQGIFLAQESNLAWSQCLLQSKWFLVEILFLRLILFLLSGFVSMSYNKKIIPVIHLQNEYWVLGCSISYHYVSIEPVKKKNKKKIFIPWWEGQNHRI